MSYEDGELDERSWVKNRNNTTKIDWTTMNRVWNYNTNITLKKVKTTKTREVLKRLIFF